MQQKIKTIPGLAYIISQFHYADEEALWQRTQSTIGPVMELINYDRPDKPLIALIKHYCSLASDKEAVLIGVQNEIDAMLQQLKPKPKPKPESENLSEVRVGGTE